WWKCCPSRDHASSHAHSFARAMAVCRRAPVRKVDPIPPISSVWTGLQDNVQISNDTVTSHILLQVKLVQECIDWATANSRLFLRRTLEARLIRLYNDIGRYVDAQKIAGPLVAELKKIEDRELIMEVTLEESKSAFALKNFGKAKNIVGPSKNQCERCLRFHPDAGGKAALDLQSGILYSADEKDFKTAYSYCYEALEGFLIADPPKAVRALKYMCLCKIMLNEAESVPLLLSSKVTLTTSR
ncbi:hypothetical protein COOONC_18564, partial [Cooperia oncophora]